MQTIDDELLAG